jgi:Replicative DNA helicase
MEFEFTNETLEKMVVKKMLTDKKFLSAISPYFDTRWFECSKPLGAVSSIIFKYYKKFDVLPNINLLRAIIEKYCQSHTDVPKEEILMSLDDASRVDVDLSLQVAKKNIEDFVRIKNLYYAISDNAEDILKRGSIEFCMDKFEKIQKFTFEEGDLGLDYFSKEGMDKHWDFINNPEDRISTGFPGLDRYTSGGFYRGGKMVACIMGQAGLGKSLFLSNIAVNCLRNNLKVVVISLEMSENVYAARFDAHISGTNINKLKEFSSTTIDRIKNFYNEHPNSNLFIKEYPPRTVKVSDIQIYLDNLIAAGNKFDIIVIDYLNLVLPNKSRDNMYQDIQDVAEKLRAISYTYGVPVVTATQSNREGMNNENIGMEHVSESSGISQTVDLLAGLYQMEEDRENGVINMRILKNRLGGCVGKVIPFNLDPETLVLTDNTFTSEDIIGTTESAMIINNLDSIENDIDSI